MFEKIYCINLDARVDRWEDSLIEFAKVGMKVERFSGIPTNVNLSYYKCLELASEHNSSLIFEDDVEFRDCGHLDSALKELPEDWDMVYLGATLNGVHKDKVGEHLYRFWNGSTAHAIGYSKKMMKWVLDNFNPLAGMIYDEWVRLNVLKNFKCYIVYPIICYQRPSFSDYRKRFVDYSHYFDKNVFI